MDLWIKTILSVYRYIERITNAIDKIVLSRASNAFYVSGSNGSFNSVFSVSEDIINLTEKKINLINLNLIIQSTLEKMNKESAHILIMCFVDKKTCYEIADFFKISLRTYFRKLAKALSSFKLALIREGYSCETFDKMLKKETWILEVKKNLEDKDMDCFQLDKNIVKKICMDYKNLKKPTNLQIHNNLTF